MRAVAPRRAQSRPSRSPTRSPLLPERAIRSRTIAESSESSTEPTSTVEPPVRRPSSSALPSPKNGKRKTRWSRYHIRRSAVRGKNPRTMLMSAANRGPITADMKIPPSFRGPLDLNREAKRRRTRRNRLEHSHCRWNRKSVRELMDEESTHEAEIEISEEQRREFHEDGLAVHRRDDPQRDQRDPAEDQDVPIRSEEAADDDANDSA